MRVGPKESPAAVLGDQGGASDIRGNTAIPTAPNSHLFSRETRRPNPISMGTIELEDTNVNLSRGDLHRLSVAHGGPSRFW